MGNIYIQGNTVVVLIVGVIAYEIMPTVHGPFCICTSICIGTLKFKLEFQLEKFYKINVIGRIIMCNEQTYATYCIVPRILTIDKNHIYELCHLISIYKLATTDIPTY